MATHQRFVRKRLADDRARAADARGELAEVIQVEAVGGLANGPGWVVKMPGPDGKITPGRTAAYMARSITPAELMGSELWGDLSGETKDIVAAYGQWSFMDDALRATWTAMASDHGFDDARAYLAAAFAEARAYVSRLPADGDAYGVKPAPMVGPCRNSDPVHRRTHHGAAPTT